VQLVLVRGESQQRTGGEACLSPQKQKPWPARLAQWHLLRCLACTANGPSRRGPFASSWDNIVSSDPDRHAERVREIEKMGATVVCLQNALGRGTRSRPPRLRGARAAGAARGAGVAHSFFFFSAWLQSRTFPATGAQSTPTQPTSSLFLAAQLSGANTP
jgi:hypothetical protein